MQYAPASGIPVPHSKASRFLDCEDDGVVQTSTPVAKRFKREQSPRHDVDPATSPDAEEMRTPIRNRVEIQDSEYDDEEAGLQESLVTPKRPTELESALPPVEIGKAAIAEYEATQAPTVGGLRKTFRSSIYVDAFNLALDTVLEDESYLFNEAEMEVFNCWKRLDYEAQYLYVRLFLRKTSAWHRISRLSYHSDIADMSKAVDALFTTRELPEPAETVKTEFGLAPPEEFTLSSNFTFATSSDDEIQTLEEASSLLSLDELKLVAKEAKVSGKNKAELLKAFQRSSRQQSSLVWTGLKRCKSYDSMTSTPSTSREASPQPPSLRHSLSTGSMDSNAPDDDRNRDNYYLRKIMDMTGECIRLSLAPLKLFERVHLVFYRSTEWTDKSLTTIILSKISKRNFPLYVVSRSANIFPTRPDLLEFEAALRAQDRIDSILEFSGTPQKAGLDEVMKIFENIYPRWSALVELEQQKEERLYDSGEGAYLRRFSPAWVYTRIAHKTCAVLAKLKLHDREYQLLTELLGQRLFHLSRRGAWHQRKALLEEHYMASLRPQPDISDFELQKKYWKKKALSTCESGLQDRDCHLIFHYDLQKRITKLEKSLKVVKREQHDFGHVQLCEPTQRIFEGIRVQQDTEETGKSTRTVWIDEREGGAECSVEEMCLSNYRDLGYKGYHCEGGILKTLFAYLFFDILFLYIPNVFQTQFQACPLDLHTDAFYPSRASEINQRLAEIANGQAARLIEEINARERNNQTCVVGLRWDFAIEDLLEIAACFDGAALATVCKVFAQEYGQRGGGIPDLFLWHPERKEVLFSEVKSENDRLSDTQRLWIHVLTGAGIKVELCSAVAKEVRS